MKKGGEFVITGRTVRVVVGAALLAKQQGV
jgi:hypothetical protein